MSTSAKPKRRPRRPKLVPLLMWASDGETYVCASADRLPDGLLKNPNVVIAIRLDRRQRDIALDSLQDGVRATAELLEGLVGGRRYDA